MMDLLTLHNLGLMAMIGALVLGWKMGAHLEDENES